MKTNEFEVIVVSALCSKGNKAAIDSVWTVIFMPRGTVTSFVYVEPVSKGTWRSPSGSPCQNGNSWAWWCRCWVHSNGNISARKSTLGSTVAPTETAGLDIAVDTCRYDRGRTGQHNRTLRCIHSHRNSITHVGGWSNRNTSAEWSIVYLLPEWERLSSASRKFCLRKKNGGTNDGFSFIRST